jgi:hypothetical protein
MIRTVDVSDPRLGGGAARASIASTRFEKQGVPIGKSTTSNPGTATHKGATHWKVRQAVTSDVSGMSKQPSEAA